MSEVIYEKFGKILSNDVVQKLGKYLEVIVKQED